LGYAMVLDQDVSSSEPVRADRRYVYHIEQGPVAAEPGAAAPRTVRTVSGATLLALHRGAGLGPEGRAEARWLMRLVLDHYLGGRPLRSRELFRPLARRVD
jgi:DNA repair protein RecO (recombination protein O)